MFKDDYEMEQFVRKQQRGVWDRKDVDWQKQMKIIADMIEADKKAKEKKQPE